MKKFILLVFVSVLMLGCVTTGQNDTQSGDIATNESMNIKALDRAEMVSPTENEDARRAYNLGTFYLTENRLAEAEKLLKEAIDLDPVFVDAMDHLGIVYRRQNRLDEAEKIYLKSIELNDKNKVPFINLAVVYQIQGRLNDAFNLYTHVVQILPDDPEGYYGIGELYYMTNNYENSLLFFDKAIELYIRKNSPYVYDAFYYKGMIYYEMNKLDEALKYLEEAQKGNPNNETLKRTIDEIRNKKV